MSNVDLIVKLDRVACAARVLRFVSQPGNNCSAYESVLAKSEMAEALRALDTLQEGSANFDCKAALAELVKQDEKKGGAR